MNTTKKTTQTKSTNHLPIKQWLYNFLQLHDWKSSQRQMLALAFVGLLSGLFHGSLASLELLFFGVSCDRFVFLLTKSKIDWDDLAEHYEKSIIRFMLVLSTVSGLPIWLSIDDTTQEKDKRSKKLVKGGKRRNKEGFCFVTAVIGVGLFFIPLIPRQFLRKAVAERQNEKYIAKTKMSQNLLEKWDSYGLRGHFVLVLIDSWYSSNDMINLCLRLNYGLIGAIKSNRNLNKKRIDRFKTGVRQNERVETVTDKYLFRLYLRLGTLKGVKETVRVLLSQRITHSDNKRTWRYILCAGMEATSEEIFSWYEKRWTVETFHQLWKNLFHLKNWRLQSISAIQNLATITVMAMGLAIYIFSRRYNKYELPDLRFKHCFMAVALTNVKETIIRGNIVAKFIT